jgi:hypothetical protein
MWPISWLCLLLHASIPFFIDDVSPDGTLQEKQDLLTAKSPHKLLKTVKK